MKGKVVTREDDPCHSISSRQNQVLSRKKVKVSLATVRILQLSSEANRTPPPVTLAKLKW